MTTYTRTREKGNALLWLIGLVAIGVIVFFALRSNRNDAEIVPGGDAAGASAQTVVLEGEVVCLPHRDTSGPTTLECAYGLKTDAGQYYGLDASGLPTDKQGGYDTGEKVSFEGTLVAQEDMPANFWNTYNVVGLLMVQDYWTYRDK